MAPTRRRFAAALTLALGALAGAGAHADPAYPSKPIRLVVSFPTGSPPDVAGRLIAERMARGLGQPIVVENKLGASGTIGMADALRQPADGYTLYSLSSTSLVAPLLYANVTMEPHKTMEPIGNVVWSYNVLVTPMDSPYRSVSDIVAAAKANPDALSFASGGNGTPAHLGGELLKQITSTSTTHVPYNQLGMALSDLSTGRTQFMFLTASAALGQINGGKLRPLAVTGSQRLPLLKNIPTMTEQGYPNFVMRAFDAFMVKAGTPRAIVERLQVEAHKAMADPQVREKLEALAMEPEAVAPAAFSAVIASEQEKWMRIGRTAKIRAD